MSSACGPSGTSNYFRHTELFSELPVATPLPLLLRLFPPHPRCSAPPLPHPLTSPTPTLRRRGRAPGGSCFFALDERRQGPRRRVSAKTRHWREYTRETASLLSRTLSSYRYTATTVANILISTNVEDSPPLLRHHHLRLRGRRTSQARQGSGGHCRRSTRRRGQAARHQARLPPAAASTRCHQPACQHTTNASHRAQMRTHAHTHARTHTFHTPSHTYSRTHPAGSPEGQGEKSKK